jgi:predicted house-cleaning noncanonical NTP pyrophosphatase (MazG superfamily)
MSLKGQTMSKAENLAAILEVIGQAESYRPVVQQAVDALKKYGPEIKDLFQGIQLGIIDIRAEVIKRLQEVHGFTKEEAIYITMDEWWGMKKSLKNTGSNKSK